MGVFRIDDHRANCVVPLILEEGIHAVHQSATANSRFASLVLSGFFTIFPSGPGVTPVPVLDRRILNCESTSLALRSRARSRTGRCQIPQPKVNRVLR